MHFYFISISFFLSCEASSFFLVRERRGTVPTEVPKVATGSELWIYRGDVREMSPCQVMLKINIACRLVALAAAAAAAAAYA